MNTLDKNEVTSDVFSEGLKSGDYTFTGCECSGDEDTSTLYVKLTAAPTKFEIDIPCSRPSDENTNDQN